MPDTPSTVLAAFREKCRAELVGNVLPFWLEHGLDREHGGVYTCLDRDGTLMDPTKSVWFQGRFAYVLSYAFNHVERNPEWLAAAKSTIDFFERTCFDARGRMYFEVAADGTPLRMRRYVFSECFAAIALAEYALASGDGACAGRAVALFNRILAFAGDSALCPPKCEPSAAAQGHSLTMILINVASVLKQVSDDPALDAQIDESVDRLMRFFVRPEFKCVLETVGPNGEFLDTCEGRTINPGHAIETSWFLMEVAEKSGDKELLKLALTILDWSLAWGWDKKYGGIISFRDCKNFPPQCYEQDMKFWWPQCETLIATQYAWNLTKKPKWLAWHRKMREWTYQRMPDKKYGEWYGYLHRDGTVAQPAKGNLFKGPFHIPRMMTKSIELAAHQ